MPEISSDDLRRLLTEYDRLAESLETSEADRERIVAAWRELHQELEATRRVAAEAEAGARRLQQERDRLLESLSLAEARAEGAPAARVIPPAEVSELVSGLLTGLGSRLGGMAVSDAEMRLKVAVDKVGDVAGFVVPGSESASAVGEGLHEITVHLHRSSE